MFTRKYIFAVVVLTLIAPLTATADDMSKGMSMSAGSSPKQPESGAVKAMGVVKQVDTKAGTVVISHEPIKDIGWPAMTMMFNVANPALLRDISVGSRVQFTLRGKTDETITSLKVAP